MENITTSEIKVKNMLRQNGKTVSIYEVIRHPELVYWRTGYSDPKQFGYFTALAKKINKAIAQCDGKNGRPTYMDALSFYYGVLKWGGGVYFTSAIHPGPKDEGVRFLRRVTPNGITRKGWLKLVNDLLIEYCNQHLIPNSWDDRERGADTTIELSENGEDWSIWDE